ncbi:MAG: 3-keto-5-aminohexanoate cleavage protein [Gemmatimonadota bacterium]
MSKLIITVAPIGSFATKADTPHLPVTPDEVIENGIQCWEAGASILHYHARDKDQKPSLDYGFFARVLEGLRKHTKLIVQISTGFRFPHDREDRIRAADLRPDMMSLNVGSVNLARGPYINDPKDVEYYAGKMIEYGVKPEIECFDVSHIHAGIDLAKRGLIKDPPYFDFVLGVKNALPYSPAHLIHMIGTLPPGALWSVIGVGKAQLPASTLGIILGGNSRVGLEDNIFYSYKVLATNRQLVERVVRLANELQREVATPDEARQMLSITNS